MWCLAEGHNVGDTVVAPTRNPSVPSQALYHWATALPRCTQCLVINMWVTDCPYRQYNPLILFKIISSVWNVWVWWKRMRCIPQWRTRTFGTHHTVIKYINMNVPSSKNLYLSHDVASGNDITPCNKINKPLVVYKFCYIT